MGRLNQPFVEKKLNMSIQFAKSEITSMVETIERDVPDRNDEDQTNKETTTSNVPDRFSDKRPNMITRLIRINNRITTTEIAELLKVSNKTVKRDIARLKKEARLKELAKKKAVIGKYYDRWTIFAQLYEIA
jgi:predicted HTH transcriptional regulator